MICKFLLVGNYCQIKFPLISHLSLDRVWLMLPMWLDLVIMKLNTHLPAVQDLIILYKIWVFWLQLCVLLEYLITILYISEWASLIRTNHIQSNSHFCDKGGAQVFRWSRSYCTRPRADLFIISCYQYLKGMSLQIPYYVKHKFYDPGTLRNIFKQFESNLVLAGYLLKLLEFASA